MASTNLSFAAARPTVDKIHALKEDIAMLASDHRILNGQFGKTPQVIQFKEDMMPWYKMEKRCDNLATLTKNLSPSPGTCELAKVIDGWAELNALFTSTRDDIIALKVAAEGPEGHEYPYNINFQLINGKGISVPSFQASVTTALKKKAKTPAKRRQPFSTPLAAQGATLKSGGSVSLQDQTPALVGKVHVKDTPSKTANETPSSSNVVRNTLPKLDVVDHSSPLDTPTPNLHASSRNSKQAINSAQGQAHVELEAAAISKSKLSLRHPLPSTARTFDPSGRHLADAETLVRYRNLDKTIASLKDSITKMTKANLGLRAIAQEQNLKIGQHELKEFKYEAKVKDLKGFAEELASKVVKNDPAWASQIGEMRGGQRVVTLHHGTNLSIVEARGMVKIGDVAEDKDRIRNARPGKWGKKPKPEMEAELGEKTDEDYDDSSPPVKRRRSGRGH